MDDITRSELRVLADSLADEAGQLARLTDDVREGLLILAGSLAGSTDRVAATAAKIRAVADPTQPGPAWVEELLTSGPHDLTPGLVPHHRVMSAFDKAPGMWAGAGGHKAVVKATSPAQIEVRIGDGITGDYGAIGGWFEGTVKLLQPPHPRFTAVECDVMLINEPGRPWHPGGSGKTGLGVVGFDDDWEGDIPGGWPGGNTAETLRNWSARVAWLGTPSGTRWQTYCYVGGDPASIKGVVPDWVKNRQVSFTHHGLVVPLNLWVKHRLVVDAGTLGGNNGRLWHYIDNELVLALTDVPWSVPAFPGDPWVPGAQRLYVSAMSGGLQPGPQTPTKTATLGLRNFKFFKLTPRAVATSMSAS